MAGSTVAEAAEPSPRRFAEEGYGIARGMVSPERCAELRAVVEGMLDPLQPPAEFEAELGYPGAPAALTAEGGDTPRRLLSAYSRHDSVRRWATDPRLGAVLRSLTGGEPLLSQCHHNCVMTKFPRHSSETLWHQDIRYWSFAAPELVSVWLALGPECPENGGLLVIPGSHRLGLERGRLDPSLFLRPDLAENRALIERAVPVELEAGDVLFFDCRLFHAAGENRTDRVKLSLVFTYHTRANRPLPGSRSARYPSVAFSAAGSRSAD